MRPIGVAAVMVLAATLPMQGAAQIYGQGNAPSGRSLEQDKRGQPSAPGPTQQAPDPFQEGLRAYTQRDYRNALRFWIPLAQRGDGAAQFNIGRMYARGEGVHRDLPEAYKWFTIASAGGRAEGQQARQALARSMTPVQMAEGQRRAEEWRQRRR